jgi:hypothetical protein
MTLASAFYSFRSMDAWCPGEGGAQNMLKTTLQTPKQTTNDMNITYSQKYFEVGLCNLLNDLGYFWWEGYFLRVAQPLVTHGMFRLESLFSSKQNKRLNLLQIWTSPGQLRPGIWYLSSKLMVLVVDFIADKCYHVHHNMSRLSCKLTVRYPLDLSR